MFGYVTPVTFVNTSVGSDIVEVRAEPGTQDVLSKRSVSINFDVAKCDIVSVVDLNTSVYNPNKIINPSDQTQDPSRVCR